MYFSGNGRGHPRRQSLHALADLSADVKPQQAFSALEPAM
jgi:hypothetical protein